MTIQAEIFEMLDTRIETLKRRTEYYEQFGNKGSSQDLFNQAVDLRCLSELQTLKNIFTYTIAWPDD